MSLYGSTFFLHTAGKKIFHEMKPIYSVRRAGNEEYNN